MNVKTIAKLFALGLALLFIAWASGSEGEVGMGQIPPVGTFTGRFTTANSLPFTPDVRVPTSGSDVPKAGAQAVLFYMDEVLGTDIFGPALTNRGIEPTSTSSPDEFASLLSSKWDCVIALHQNSYGSQPFDTPLASYVGGGGRAILVDWRMDERLGLAFEGSYTGSTNLTPITIGVHSIWDGLPSSVALNDPGWNTWSMGLAPIGGGVGTGSFPNGDAAVVVGNGGRTILNGMLSDTFATFSQGVAFAENEIEHCLAGDVKMRKQTSLP